MCKYYILQKFLSAIAFQNQRHGYPFVSVKFNWSLSILPEICDIVRWNVSFINRRMILLSFCASRRSKGEGEGERMTVKYFMIGIIYRATPKRDNPSLVAVIWLQRSNEISILYSLCAHNTARETFPPRDKITATKMSRDARFNIRYAGASGPAPVVWRFATGYN